MSKGKGQQVMEHSLFLLEFQLPGRKDTLQTAQKCYQLKLQSFYRCQVKSSIFYYASSTKVYKIDQTNIL